MLSKKKLCAEISLFHMPSLMINGKPKEKCLVKGRLLLCSEKGLAMAGVDGDKDRVRYMQAVDVRVASQVVDITSRLQ